MLRCIPDDPRLIAGEVHCQRGVASLQETGVGHEVGGADDRHGAAVIAVADDGAVVAPRDRHVAGGFEGVAPIELYVPGPGSLPQVAVRRAAEAARRSAANRGRERLPGARHRFDDKPIAGDCRQPMEDVVVDEVDRLHRHHQCVRSSSAFDRSDVVGDYHVDAVVAQQRHQCVRAIGRG